MSGWYTPKLPRGLSGEDAIRALVSIGFIRGRCKGSHVALRRFASDGDVVTVVPLHDELKTGTLRSILRLAKVSVDEFCDNL